MQTDYYYCDYDDNDYYYYYYQQIILKCHTFKKLLRGSQNVAISVRLNGNVFSRRLKTGSDVDEAMSDGRLDCSMRVHRRW